MQALQDRGQGLDLEGLPAADPAGVDAVSDEGLGVPDENVRSRDTEPELVVLGQFRFVGKEAGPFERLPAREDGGERDTVAPQEAGEVDPRGNVPGPRTLRIAEAQHGTEDEPGGGSGLENGHVHLEPAGKPEVVVVEKRDEGRRDAAEGLVSHGAASSAEGEGNVTDAGGPRRGDDASRLLRAAVFHDDGFDVAKRLRRHRCERLGEERWPAMRGDDDGDAGHGRGYSRQTPAPASREARMGPLRLLVVKLSSLGDVAHAVPSVAALARRFPRAEIDWLVEPPAAPFVAQLPWVAETVVVDVRGALGRGWADLLAERERVATLLADRRYELVVDLQGLLRSSLWTLWSGASRRVGRGRWPWLHTSVPMYDRRRTPHAVENTARAVEALGASVAEGWEEAQRGLAPLAARLRAAGALEAERLGLPRRFTAAFPMSSGRAKSIPPEWLERWPGPPLVLLGDERLASFRPGREGILNRAGAMPLLGSLGLALAAEKVVTADTGPGHMAALLGAESLSILGPTNPARTGLRGPRARSVGAPCGGCEERRCRKATRCLAEAFGVASGAL